MSCAACGGPLHPCPDCSLWYCSSCETHVESDGTPVEEVRSGRVAATVGELAAPAGEVGLIAGKVLEEELQEFFYRRDYQRDSFGGTYAYAYRPKRAFAARLAARLREEGAYSDARVARGVRILAALLAAGIGGRTPPTEHRVHASGPLSPLVVYAKADFLDLSDKPALTEFKSYPLDAYARIQAQVAAWAYDQPVRLVGAVGAEWVDLEIEIVTPDPDPIVAYREA